MTEPTIIHGDCLTVMAAMDAESVDAIVCDPPAGIAFMNRSWDSDKGGRDAWIAWLADVMREAYRVAKPGAHAVVWALPRTSGWTHRALEDAGWEIRDCITHITGQGFPKSLDVGKALDKMAGAEREVIGLGRQYADEGGARERRWEGGTTNRNITITDPATDLARQWDGWGTALKPAAEFWFLARKPLAGTVAQNVAAYGTGAINVDATRIGTELIAAHGGGVNIEGRKYGGGKGIPAIEPGSNPHIGRWPANLLLDEDAAALLDAMSGERPTGGQGHNGPSKGQSYAGGFKDRVPGNYSDSGGASRFFFVAPSDDVRFAYVPKASRAERSAGLDSPSTHPTVKPIALMRWLVRLVTPPNGLVLDPFMGSGTTGAAAALEGVRFVGIEQDAEYVSIARQRIAHWSERAEQAPPQLALPLEQTA